MESWKLSENRTPVQDEFNSAVAQVLTSYTYDNPFPQTLLIHTIHYTPHILFLITF